MSATSVIETRPRYLRVRWWRGQDLHLRPSGYEPVVRHIGRCQLLSDSAADLGLLCYRRRTEGWTERYLDAGFDEIVQGETTLEVGRTSVLLSHFPYRGDSHDRDRYVNHRPVDRGAWLLHGHVHERWAQRGRMINVGVDATDFRPINEHEIAARIANGPQDREQPGS